jgi:hypothetical protein
MFCFRCLNIQDAPWATKAPSFAVSGQPGSTNTGVGAAGASHSTTIQSAWVRTKSRWLAMRSQRVFIWALPANVTGWAGVPQGNSCKYTTVSWVARVS